MKLFKSLNTRIDNKLETYNFTAINQDKAVETSDKSPD